MHDFWSELLRNVREYWTIVASAKSEVLAAWFQAVGSVGAIIAAIWISRHQANVARTLASDEFDRQSEAVSSFATVQQINIRNEVRRIRAIIGNNEANLGILEKSGTDAALSNLLFASTSVDNYILSNASSLPKEARTAFPQLIAMKEMYNAVMRELYEKMEKAKDKEKHRRSRENHRRTPAFWGALLTVARPAIMACASYRLVGSRKERHTVILFEVRHTYEGHFGWDGSDDDTSPVSEAGSNFPERPSYLKTGILRLSPPRPSLFGPGGVCAIIPGKRPFTQMGRAESAGFAAVYGNG
jgi:hypothetical protein